MKLKFRLSYTRSGKLQIHTPPGRPADYLNIEDAIGWQRFPYHLYYPERFYKLIWKK